MGESSLFKFLMTRIGAPLGVVVLALSTLFYFQNISKTADADTLTLLEESKQFVLEAEKDSDRFLATGQSKALDDYNQQIVQLNSRVNTLAQKFANAPETQTKLYEMQKKFRGYFSSVNENLVRKQNGTYQAERAPAAVQKKPALLIEGMIQDIKENSSQPQNFLGLTLPWAQWKFLFGLLFASFCILAGHLLQRTSSRHQRKNISDLQIQSILLEGILNSMSEALLVIDEKGRFTRYNIAAQRIIGTKLKSIASEADAQALGFYNLEGNEPLPLKELPFARAFRAEQLDDLELRVQNEQHPEGMYISLSSRYLNDIDGSIRGALVVFRDISRRKATEKEWLKAREAAVEASRKKSDFLAAMSHEIRTPMNGVIGMTTLLADTTLNTEQNEYVGTIKRSAESLLMLINDILDHSKIEAGKIQLNPRPFDLKFLANDVLELFMPAVREKNIDLDLKLKGEAAWKFVGDDARLRQILVNLLGNAIKFTEKGFVALEISCQLQENGAAALKFEVRDSGPGLEEEEKNSLFQKYFQAKAGMKYGGTGLGLSICRQLVDLMHGQIGLESTPGEGSNFWFTVEFPLAANFEKSPQQEATFAAIFHGRVLLAEDQMVNQRVATTYLRKMGLEVDTANNGQIAVEKALTQKYDLIFMDCQMPVMTGYEATQQLRQKLSQPLPIIALTAEGTSGERSACFAAGMDDFLTKPLVL
jgi:signal transduction histidine kinase